MSLQDQMKANKRVINKAIREMDRERAGLEREKAKLERDIKKLAKQNEMVRYCEGERILFLIVFIGRSENYGERPCENQAVYIQVLCDEFKFKKSCLENANHENSARNGFGNG